MKNKYPIDIGENVQPPQTSKNANQNYTRIPAPTPVRTAVTETITTGEDAYALLVGM